MFHLMFILMAYTNVQAYTKLKLQGSQPLYMDCQPYSQIENSLVGNQYFYDFLSQKGTLLSLERISFSLWIMVHSDMKLLGRQMIFSFVDGFSSNPYLNLMLYYQIESEDYYMYLVNQRMTPEIMRLKIVQQNNLFKDSWNHIFISIDQSSVNQTYINLKFFSTQTTQLFQKVDTLINEKLLYKFGVHSRLTNEPLLYNQLSDYKACINIADFYYINGWTSMDQEIYVDYEPQLKFALKPYASNGLIVDNIFTGMALRSSTFPIEYSGSIGLNLYKNSQIVYNFLEEMTSLTVMFWIKPQNIQSSFQFLSLTDDILQETSLGFGVNKNYNLLFYQVYTKTSIGDLKSNSWKHVTAGFLDVSLNQNFQPQNQIKVMRVFIDNDEVTIKNIINIKPFKRLVIGPVFMDDQGQEIIDIQDIKIFKGYGIIQTYKNDCQLFVGDYCAFCISGTHYCKEQDPKDDIKVYDCPAGFKYQNKQCSKIIVPNCLRMTLQTCEICSQGYQLTNGLCQAIITSIVSSPFYCTDKDAQFCAMILMKQLGTTQQQDISKLCLNNKYSFNQLTCSGQEVPKCLISQYQNQCAQCQLDYALPQTKTCSKSCSNNLRFMLTNGTCVSKCTKYLFSIKCTQQQNIIISKCNPSQTCQSTETDIGYYCLTKQQSTPKETYSCTVIHEQVYENKLTKCDQTCKYCYGFSNKHCLGCYDQMYFNPHITSCLSDCYNANQNARFIYNNKYTWTCELECPSWLYTQNYDCVKQCSDGYKLYKNNCLLKTVMETYESTQIINNQIPVTSIAILKDCPEFCQSCTSYTFCTSCLNLYPMDQNMCVKSCYPQYLQILDDSRFCKSSCDPGDLIYQNDNLNGYQINQCFKKKCGFVQANREYQTFLHQTDTLRCMYPCEDGYYGHPILFQCQPCNSNCGNCNEKPTICTSCQPLQFLEDSVCFDSCQDKFQNYINWMCEGSCSSGYKVMDTIQNVNACVQECGQVFATFIYSWNNSCYEQQPVLGAYCEGLKCYNCNYKCKTCSGPNQNQCLSCKQKTYLQNNECVKYCILQFYDNLNWKCVDQCPQDSYTTTGYQTINSVYTKVTQCAVTCLYNQYQYKDKCFNSQPYQTYCFNRDNYYYCDNCASVCQECKNAYSTSCTKCSVGAYLYGTTCYVDCPSNAPYKNDITQKCVTNCPQYVENGRCVILCSFDFFVSLVERQCYQMGCPLGTYHQNYQKICYGCYTGCATCLNGTQSGCLSCLPGYFLNGGSTCLDSCIVEPDLVQDWVNGQCVQQCPQGTFLQKLSNNQLACKEDCPIYYYSNICVSACPEQTYLNQQACKSCASPCSECYGPKIDECTNCDLGYYRDQTTCYAICPEYKPYANLADQTCVANCPDLLYLPNKLCFSPCPTFLYYYELNGKKECVDKCYSKSYLWLDQCHECDPICKECFGPNNGNCLECELPYFLNEQTCEMTCPLFYDLTDHICKDACPVHLVIQGLQCQNQCDLGYIVYNQVCVTECPSFAYKVDNYCYDCNLFCSTCFGSSADECYSCIDEYFLDGQSCKQVCPQFFNKETNKCISDCNGMYQIPEKKECVSQCPINYIICESKCLLKLEDGYYQENNKCIKCDSRCTKCTSATLCQSCAKNFYLEIQSCANFCSNQYLFMDPISRSCVTKCPSILYHLESYGKRFCVANCPFKYNEQCVIACPQGMYSKNTVCTKCPQNCVECESATNCTKCLNGLYLENGQCLSTCITGKTDKKNIICVDACDSSLFEYQNYCLETCPTDPILFNKQKICYQNCPSNTYQNKQECIDCDVSCLTCIGPTDKNCITCSDGYFLDNQFCTKTCTSLYDQVNKQCVLTCPSNLYQENDKCLLTCSNYRYINNCVNTCPPITYASNSICYDCSENCQECNSIGCTKCNSGTYLNDGLCNNYCPYYYNYVNNQCTQLCPKDTYVYIDHCYSQCPMSTYQYKNDCLLACPSLTVLINTECISCPERCITCLSKYECSKCESPYFLFNGSCVIHCPLQQPYEDIDNLQCVSSCPPESYEREYQCIKECNLIIHQKQCLKTCPSGYYGNDYCQPCRLECKACSSFDVCIECNENFFLEFNQCDTQCSKIKDLKSKECVDVCNSYLYKNVCYEVCPQNTYQYLNQCVLKCHDGYYGSTDKKCLQCPLQCLNCINSLECTKCNIGFFLYNKQCLDKCPEQYFSNPILNECSTKCPNTTFMFQNSCFFECPQDYFNDMENYKCVKDCGLQQYISKKNCLRCSIECDQCTENGNNNCIKCASGFQLTADGLCIGNCKDGYYKTDNSCYQCLHKCQTCATGIDCIKCRGTNRNPQDCSCSKGYYDDKFQDDCKRCPCDECTSNDNCLICKNNLQIPKCTCDRILNDNWCITCKVAKVDIYYSDDLNQIIVYFGYLISVNLVNPFQPSNCSLWFDKSEIFGQNALCYQSWDRYAIHIILKPYASVNIGDELNFKSSFYRDVDQGICDGLFIEQFIENKVKEPQSFQKPYILFDVPSFVSTCKTIFIKQHLLIGTGQKIQNVLSWTLKQMENDEQFLQMDSFLATQQNEITIPIGTLEPNVTYTITAKYINFLHRVNYTTFSFTTLPIQAPYVYLSYEPLIARVYVFDCHITYSDLKNEFNVVIEITGKNNESYIQLTQQINPIYDIPLNETLLPKETPLYFMAATGSSIIKEVIYLKSKIIDIKFYQKNRFIGLDNQINARGFDRNIQDDILNTIGINYEWLCNNLHNLQPCKTDENQIMQFPSRRIINIFADSQNTTFVFFARASKGNRWTVKEQLIVITDFNIEEEFYMNNNEPQDFINTNDQVTVLIKQQQKYAFIIQQHKILDSLKITGLQLKFRLTGLTTDYITPIYIYLVPGNESIAFKLNDPPKDVIFLIEPLIGESLDYFNYTIKNLQENNQVGIYYYFDNTLLEDDLNAQSIIHGIPLITKSNEILGSFQLPNGITNNSISVLCEIQSSFGSKSYLKQDVYVVRKNYELQQLYQSFTNIIKLDNLQSLHTMIELIQLEEQQVCLKQCSGVGTCVNKKCQCPPGYYFTDCSGSYEQQIKFNDFMTNVLLSLINKTIKDDGEMKLFSQSLHFLTQFNNNNDTLSLEDCQTILLSYIQNTNTRLEQINQYSINLQYQSTKDYNYSQIDIRTLINKDDLHTALKSTVFMWGKTLFTSGSNVYKLQHHLNNFINNIIELSIFALGPNEKIDFSIDTASINIYKSKNIPYNSSRVLEEINSDQTEGYDIVEGIYIRNFYAFDGYYPYPLQIYPLYVFQVRQSDRKDNIELNQPISYRFRIQNDSSNLVCLQRNSKTYEWSNSNCSISEINSTYFCNCTTLSPTTICNDYNYLYKGAIGFKIIIPNIFYIIYIIQFIILGIFLSKAKTQDNRQVTKTTKFGQVFKLARNTKMNLQSSRVFPAEFEKDTSELIVNQQISNQEKHKDKFDFNHFWKYHCLTSLIYKQQSFISPLMRSILILLRWNVAVIIGEVLSLQEFEYDISIWIILASQILLRFSENFLKKQMKYVSVMRQIILAAIIKGLILLVLIFTFLCGIYFYLMIDNQTKLIISYGCAILIDILLLDAIVFSSNRFLGENKKENIRKKIKEIKQFEKLKQQNE